jgi:hypothetical protein
MSEIHRRVPWLWRIPILGHLFRYDSVEKRRVELLIIMTPWIIRTPEDDERFKQREAARMHWCLATVNQMHGDTGLYDITGPVGAAAGFEQNPNVVYPDAQGVILPDEVGKEGQPPDWNRASTPETIPTPRPLERETSPDGLPPEYSEPSLFQPPTQSPSPRDDQAWPHPEPNVQGAPPTTSMGAPVRSGTNPWAGPAGGTTPSHAAFPVNQNR